MSDLYIAQVAKLLGQTRFNLLIYKAVLSKKYNSLGMNPSKRNKQEVYECNWVNT